MVIGLKLADKMDVGHASTATVVSRWADVVELAKACLISQNTDNLTCPAQIYELLYRCLWDLDSKSRL